MSFDAQEALREIIQGQAKVSLKLKTAAEKIKKLTEEAQKKSLASVQAMTESGKAWNAVAAAYKEFNLLYAEQQEAEHFKKLRRQDLNEKIERS